MNHSFSLRPADESDRTYIQRLNFLTDVLGDEDAPLDAENYIAWREFYVDEWSAEDGGFIAYDALGIPAGGVWLRWGTQQRHGMGFVEDTIPELAIAVEHRFRGQGLGTMLLEAAIAHARNIHAPGISLCVDQRNPGAHALYQRVGFRDRHFDELSHHFILSYDLR